jgi:hypothetical protein
LAGGLGELVPGYQIRLPSRSKTIHVCRLGSNASGSASDMFESEASHAGMYAHDSTSSVTNMEWITIHLLSDVQVMMPSIQAATLVQSLHRHWSAGL